MDYEYFPPPDPNMEPVAPWVKENVLKEMRAARRRRRLRIAPLILAGILLVAAAVAVVRRIQPAIATEPRSTPRPAPRR